MQLENLMHLTALKRLRKLKLKQPPTGYADALTGSVLPKLPMLASLSLDCTGFTSLCELSGLSKLTRLTELHLMGWEKCGEKDEGLLLLHPLKPSLHVYGW